MFFEGDRIDAMREMILADLSATAKRRWPSCCPYQREDFTGIFKASSRGLPATIRLLDPPLHEFPPEQQGSSSWICPEEAGRPVEKIMHRVHELHEFNPMLGFRGCRLGIKYPEITEMQARAVFEAAADVAKKDQGEARDHDPARRLQEGTRPSGRNRARNRERRFMAEKKVKLNYSSAP
jgi:pyruvate,orthophosphate dikinase